MNNGLAVFCKFLSESMHKKCFCAGLQECLAVFPDFVGFYLDTNKELHFSSCTSPFPHAYLLTKTVLKFYNKYFFRR